MIITLHIIVLLGSPMLRPSHPAGAGLTGSCNDYENSATIRRSSLEDTLAYSEKTIACCFSPFWRNVGALWLDRPALAKSLKSPLVEAYKTKSLGSVAFGHGWQQSFSGINALTTYRTASKTSILTGSGSSCGLQLEKHHR